MTGGRLGDPFVGPEALSVVPRPVVVDVRWYPDGRDGRVAYDAGHLPGAIHVELDGWLAGPPEPSEGRHPLPDPAVFAEAMTRAGIGDGTPVVAYDDAGGTIAARLVWMLRVLGENAAVLDGGLGAWPGPVEVGPGPDVGSRRPAVEWTQRSWPAERIASVREVEEIAATASAATASGGRASGGTASGGTAAGVLLDARSAERYEGAPDALDPRAGHIPGARSLPCRDQLGSDGRLLPDDQLRARLAAVGVVAGGPAVISSCGSGVTACHTLLVMEHLGLSRGRLYVGSWSQWSRSDRPVVTGPDHR